MNNLIYRDIYIAIKCSYRDISRYRRLKMKVISRQHCFAPLYLCTGTSYACSLDNCMHPTALDYTKKVVNVTFSLHIITIRMKLWTTVDPVLGLLCLYPYCISRNRPYIGSHLAIYFKLNFKYVYKYNESV